MPQITITNIITAPIEFVFDSYLSPDDNLQWNTAGEGWTTSYATINPISGGEYHIGYKSPDEKNDFDFGGTYTEIRTSHLIKSVLGDGRHVEVRFVSQDQSTEVIITFDTEDENSIELQKAGWGSILLNFKNFVERKANPHFDSIAKSIDIDAPRESVWDILLQDQSYRLWTKVFTEGSYYDGEMKYGEKIRFLSPNGIGISSRIVVYIPNYRISFEHLGVVNNGIEEFESSHSEGWKGVRETYTLTEKNGITTLEIYVETTKNEKEMMSKIWDEAILIIRKLSETPDLLTK